MIKLDARFTFDLEFTGNSLRPNEPQWVARFCGDYIGQSPSAVGAKRLAVEYNEARFND